MELNRPLSGKRQAAPLIGAALGRYRVGEFIGGGGMGDVYQARDELLGKDVAIKALKSARVNDESARLRFAREAKYACRVQHPFVCTVFDVVVHGDDVFIVMELIRGRQLDEAVEQDRPSRERILEWAIEITEALSAIHKAGVVHRDLKPANVMIASDGHVKVTDFGVAQALGESPSFDGSTAADTPLTASGNAVGTVSYMSPEQIRGEHVDPRSDLFSLGILLWQTVTGEHPFERATPFATAAAIQSEAPGSGGEPAKLTSAGSLRDVVVGLLHKERADRYPSAEVVLRDLRAVARGERVRPLVEQAKERARRRRAAWLTASSVLAAGLAVTIWWLSRPSPDPTGLPPVPARPTIAVLPFEIREFAEADARGDMLADLIAASVSESGELRRTPMDRMDELLAGLPTGPSRRDAVKRLAALSPRFIVAGTVYPVPDGLESTIDLYSGNGTATGSFRVRAPGYLGLVDRASAQILAAAGVSPGAGGEKRIDAAGTRSEEAALLLAKAKRAARELRYGDALQLSEQALAIDPRYLDAAIAHVYHLNSCGYGRRCAEAGEKLSRLVDSLGLVAGSRHRLEAEVAIALARNRSSDRYDTLKVLATRYPDDPEVLGGLALASIERNLAGDALALADRALGLDREAPSLLILHARAARSLRRFDAAERDLAAAEKLVRAGANQPGIAAVLEARGHMARAAGKSKDAESLYLACADAFDRVGRRGNAARCRANAAQLRVEAGDLNGARSEILPAISDARATGALGSAAQYLNTLGGAEYVGGALGEAESTFREAYGLARQIDNDRVLLPVVANLAGLIGNTDRFAEALGLADETIALARAQGDTGAEAAALLVRCDASLADGRIGQARACYQDLVEFTTSRDVEADKPLWARLGRAEVEQVLGLVGEAWLDVRSVLDAKGIPPLVKAYGLWREASLLCAMGDGDAAERSLKDAEAMANSAGGTLADLVPRLALVRATLENRAGRFDSAAALIQRVEQAGKASGGQGLLSPALSLTAETLVERGKPQAALESAQAALDAPGARFVERVRARIAAASALSGLGDPDGALKSARRALDEAKGASIRPECVEAAGLIAALAQRTRVSDLDAVRRDGLAALDAWIDSCPPQQRRNMTDRPDVARWSRALGRTPRES